LSFTRNKPLFAFSKIKSITISIDAFIVVVVVVGFVNIFETHKRRRFFQCKSHTLFFLFSIFLKIKKKKNYFFFKREMTSLVSCKLLFLKPEIRKFNILDEKGRNELLRQLEYVVISQKLWINDIENILDVIDNTIDLNHCDFNYGVTALNWASRLPAFYPIVERLIEKGADVNDSNMKDKSNISLVLSVGNGCNNIALLLINSGANINILGFQDRTLLFTSLKSPCGDQSISKLLIKMGAKINHQDKKGDTVLISVLKHCLEHGHDQIEYIMSIGINPFIKNKKNKTALDVVLKRIDKLYIMKIYWNDLVDVPVHVEEMAYLEKLKNELIKYENGWKGFLKLFDLKWKLFKLLKKQCDKTIIKRLVYNLIYITTIKDEEKIIIKHPFLKERIERIKDFPHPLFAKKK
jgi:hypothetical protein